MGKECHVTSPNFENRANGRHTHTHTFCPGTRAAYTLTMAAAAEEETFAISADIIQLLSLIINTCVA